jgi:hypothetical protein
MKRFGQALLAIALTVVAVFGIVGPAQAATYNLWGTLNVNAPPTYYPTYRYHSSGMAWFNLVTKPPCGGTFRMGLRYNTGVQATQTLVWGAYGPKAFVSATTGSTIIPTGSYAVTVSDTGVCGTNPHEFTGVLTL